MSRIKAAAFLGLIMLNCQGMAPAMASSLSFVSGAGVDTGDCSKETAPCRTMQYAHNQTAIFGEIKALDAANYFGLTINRPITITGVEGATLVRGSPGDVITVNPGPVGGVTLRNLTINGLHGATNGIRLKTVKSLTIEHCLVTGFAGSALHDVETPFLYLKISDTVFSDSNWGIKLGSGSSYFATLTRIRVQDTEYPAFWIIGPGPGGSSSRLTIVDSTFTTSGKAGIEVGAGGAVKLSLSNVVLSGNRGPGLKNNGPNASTTLAHSLLVNNEWGVSAPQGAVWTAGDNVFRDNNRGDVETGDLRPFSMK